MKKLFCILSLIVVGCGFTPMYSENQPARDIYIAPISGTSGIDLRNNLRAAFNTDNNPSAKYTLTVDLAAPRTIYKALQTTGDATWQEVQLSATYKLTETDGGKEVLAAKDTASESYTFVRDLVAAQASYNNSIQSTIRVLSEKMITRINAKLSK